LKTSIIRSSWMPGYGYRLDCQPYLGGSLEAKLLLEELPLRKDSLSDLLVGGEAGIYFAGRESVRWVESSAYGIPFLRGKDIQLADLTDSPWISKKQISSNSTFLIRKGMTLITRSGTIGKTAYVRDDMDGMASSDPLRVAPDPQKIPAGYLYTFLSSKFGIPLVASGTYGAIIQHLESRDLNKIPVPRIGDALEHEIHRIVERAAELRTKASRVKRESITAFIKLCGLPDLMAANKYPTPQLGLATSANLAERMDSTYYIAPCLEARASFDAAGRKWQSKSLGEVAEVFIPTIFKRLYADDPEFGYPYLTGADVFCIRPTSTQYLMRKVAHENRLVLQKGMILLHEAGQRYGLIGRGVMVGRTLDGFACTNNMVRLIPNDAAETGFIFTALSSEYGVRLLKREAAGSSIPHLDSDRIASVKIPWPDKSIRSQVAALAHEARECWDRADELEREADAKIVVALTRAVK
jgi:type I restriction enzyme S subunit